MKNETEHNDGRPLALRLTEGLGPPATCGACQHSAWERTHTGRIKNGVPGSCTKEREVLGAYLGMKHPPCVVIRQPTLTRIWPEFDASGCPLRA